MGYESNEVCRNSHEGGWNMVCWVEVGVDDDVLCISFQLLKSRDAKSLTLTK